MFCAEELLVESVLQVVNEARCASSVGKEEEKRVSRRGVLCLYAILYVIELIRTSMSQSVRTYTIGLCADNRLFSHPPFRDTRLTAEQ